VRLLTETEGSDSPAVEAFRALRANLQFPAVKGSTRLLGITSTVADEGKTTVAVNLAAVTAMAGTRCILVNADLRRPVMAHVFGRSGRVGLTHVLAGSAQLDEVLLETGVTGLRLLPAGQTPPNPAELLGSAAMVRVLGELKERAEVVIVDTPPLLPLSDALVVAPRVDGMILVVRAGRTPRQAVLASKQRLETVGSRILGVVLNGVKPGDGYYHYYYHHYYRHADGAHQAAATR
jgi:non-specific protein-tyrosine kinase